MTPGPKNLAISILIAAALFLGIAAPTIAHAVLLESSPALKGSVSGPDVPLKLRFNVRIDSARSRLTLVRPDGSSQALEVNKQAPPDTLLANATGLMPGEYRLRWQVLAADGHITRGEIPFTVAAS
jgi:copper resistance protein C